MNNLHKIDKITLEELSIEIGSETMNRRASKKSIKNVNEINDLFWGFQNRFFKIDPKNYPELDKFNGEEYYIAVNYEVIPGNGGGLSEFNAYTAGFLKLAYGKNFAYLDFVADDKDNDYFLKNGTLQHGDDEVHFGHASQLLEPYKSNYSLSTTSEEGLYDELIKKSVPRELAPIFFNLNVKYSRYATPNEWTYSLSNNFYFSGVEYNYWDLENMSREFIVSNYSDYVYLNDSSDAHHVFSRMTDYLIDNGLIKDEQKVGNVLRGVSMNRLNTIKWLGITPENKKPAINSLSSAKIVQTNIKTDDTVQIDINAVADIVLENHKNAVKYEADWLEIEVEELFDCSLRGEVLEVIKNVALVDTDAGRVRVDASFLVKDGEMLYSQDEIDNVKEQTARVIEEFDKAYQSIA